MAEKIDKLGFESLERYDLKLKEHLEKRLDEKPDFEDLSNVVAEEVVDVDTFEDFDKVTREELKKDLLIDMWNESWKINNVVYGKYDPDNAPDPEHPFMGNEIWMTYQEAIVVLETYSHFTGLVSSALPPYAFAMSDARTLPPLYGNGNGLSGAKFSGIFKYCKKIETIIVLSGNLQNVENHAFYDCRSLKRIELNSDLSITFKGSNIFYNAINLKIVKITRLVSDIDLSVSNKITYDSFDYIIKKAINASPITITVHPNVFAALEGNADSYPFNGGTQEEWSKLLEDATARQISFASA